jgi:hypothetical protein
VKRTVISICLPLLFACSTEDDDDGMIDQFPQCMTAAYIAFDPANHANQEIRVQAHADMVARMNEAVDDPSTAAAKFAEARRLYEESADLRSKVMGRVDPHDGTAIGTAIDLAIVDGLDDGATATTALAANLAKQKVDKTMIHFFYLSVFYEMTEGDRKTWDEAFGYYNGGSTDNAEGARKGFAVVATKRDVNNNTNLAETLFNTIVDGSCELAKALSAANAEMIDYKSVPALKSRVDEADLDMQKVLAYSAGHEAFDIIELQADLSTLEAREEMWIKLAELDPYFRAVEPYIDAAVAAGIRSAIDAAWADPTGAWMATFPAQMIIEDLESEYTIDIRG